MKQAGKVRQSLLNGVQDSRDFYAQLFLSTFTARRREYLCDVRLCESQLADHFHDHSHSQEPNYRPLLLFDQPFLGFTNSSSTGISSLVSVKPQRVRRKRQVRFATAPVSKTALRIAIVKQLTVTKTQIAFCSRA